MKPEDAVAEALTEWPMIVLSDVDPFPMDVAGFGGFDRPHTFHYLFDKCPGTGRRFEALRRMRRDGILELRCSECRVAFWWSDETHEYRACEKARSYAAAPPEDRGP